MSVAPPSEAVYAIKTWTCPQCGADCRDAELRWPALGPEYGKIKVIACIGMTCDLVFDRSSGMLLGHQSDGEFVPLEA